MYKKWKISPTFSIISETLFNIFKREQTSFKCFSSFWINFLNRQKLWKGYRNGKLFTILSRSRWVAKFSIFSFLIKFHSTLYFLITLNNSLWQQKWKLIKKILSKTLTNFFQIFLVFLNSSILKNFEKDTETESFSQLFLNRGGCVGKFSILSFLIKFHSTLYFLITLNDSSWQKKMNIHKKDAL